jgi:LPXTG-site transpeptidase (sortase) family protein
MKNLLGKLSIFAGIVCVIWGSFLLWRRADTRYFEVVKAKKTIATIAPYTNSMPTRISIPTIGVDLPVIPSKIVRGKWEETTIGVSYIAKSPIPGEIGNSILYGHNWPTLLGDLPLVKPGDKITIAYQNTKPRRFTVVFINIVSPDTTSVLLPTADRRITLYTCTGFLDSKRLVITAILDDEPALISQATR